MASVRVLPPSLASQIAAGEVVERPASALKELVENALDAGALRCDVEIRGGGVTLLRVRDDGCGMSPEDARLAVERHATSKLSRFEDLDDLPSFGFRGEALPSIASVSRLRLETRRSEDDAGTRVSVEGGAEPEVQEVGVPAGTEVTVEDLFFNVPARRKFLRSSGTESGHVADVLENAALGCPGVTFTLTRDGRRAKEWLRAASREARVASALPGEELAQCGGERGPLRVEAYLGRPERARAGSTGLKLFCNERPIRDRTLLATIAQAYGSVLERGRYPRGVVYLNLSPRLVDINVHPQKAEVRFADARAVADSVYHILQASLRSAFSIPTTEGPSRAPQSTAPEVPISTSRGSLTSRSSRGSLTPQRPRFDRGIQAAAGGRAAPAQTSWMVADVEQPRSVPAEPEAGPTDTSAGPRVSGNDHERWSQLKFTAQVRATYLVCEGEAGLYLLDQHAAAERVTFHRLKREYDAKQMASQSLLFPLTLEMSPEHVELVESKSSEILRLGFEVRVRGESTVSLHSVPRLLHRASPERLLLDLVTELARGGRAFSDSVNTALSTIACHGSIRAGDQLSAKEAAALLTALDEVDFAGHCPHGRPIVSFTPWTELERKVGRR